MSVHTRSSYLPRTLVGNEDGTLSLELDWLNAPYLDLDEKITKFSSHMISQAFEGRPDLIAHRLYGDVNLWWVIVQFNGLINPFQDLTPGMVIKVPDYSQLMHVLHESTEELRAFLAGKTSEGSNEDTTAILV